MRGNIIREPEPYCTAVEIAGDQIGDLELNCRTVEQRREAL